MGNTVPQERAAIKNQADELSHSVQGKNLTDSIGKTLLIQMTALQGQGIADSANAQVTVAEEALALAQSQQKPLPPTYAQSNLTFSSNSPNDLRAFGNLLPKTINAHPKAAGNVALYPLAVALDNNSEASLSLLRPIAAEYRALAAAVMKLPTPPMFAPYSVALANNYMAIAVACDEMAQVHGDPLRGMLGLQNFVERNAQNAQVLYRIGETLKNSGIVFTRAESGAIWSTFMVAVQRAAKQQTTQ